MAAVTELSTENVEEEGEEFKDLVDSPYGVQHAEMLVGDGDEVDNQDTEFTIEQATSAEDGAFDSTVGALEEIVISDEFQALLSDFCHENAHHFEDSEENKLIYTELFKKYSDLIEGQLEEKLKARIPGFDMGAFSEELERRGQEEVDSSVFDLLVTLGDFESFKQHMLETKVQTPSSLSIAGTRSKIYKDEQEDGEERPELGDLLTISPASPSAAKGKKTLAA